ncbi:hypothetical protein ACE1CI_15490 [Aerosakkonemataceae cyanobacterium BLCC-F50]|uniref:Uncharacterized protein n=1 Tax=Floridaenema flaviceps BLCC-F50 TaxID=3153642 RepID=A0ABV4XRF7_9CYAN
MLKCDRTIYNSLVWWSDPWNGTRYKMYIEEFLNYWTLFAVYQVRQ